MASKAFIATKIFLSWLYYSVFFPLPHVLLHSETFILPAFAKVIIVIMFFLPEEVFFLALAVKGIRNWLKEGFEDGDGVFNSKDVIRLIVTLGSTYLSIFSFRICIWYVYVDTFIKDVDTTTFITFLGASSGFLGGAVFNNSLTKMFSREK